MSGDIGDITGAVGDAVTGTAAAAIAEPDSSHGGQGTGGSCLNCGAVLQGAHCHSCGQKAHIHRTLRGFLHDLVHGVLHFEGKFWRTMPLLLWRPGVVIREYIDGKRVKYVSPVALFLFTVFVSFAIFSATGGFGEVGTEISPATEAELRASLKEADAEVAELNADLTADNITDGAAAALRDEIALATSQRDMLAAFLENSEVDENPDGIIKVGSDGDSSIAADSPVVTTGGGEAATDNLADWINAAWKKAQANPGLLVYKLQTNAYKLSWLLIPISLPFLWLLFPFSRRFKMYDHTVFITYSISFMTMLAVVLSFGIAFQFPPLIIGPLLYAPFHLYRSLRGTYMLSRSGAFWRMLVLSLFIWIAMTIFVLIMIGIVIGA